MIRRYCEYTGCREHSIMLWKTRKENGDAENKAYCNPHMEVLIKDSWRGCKREDCSKIEELAKR